MLINCWQKKKKCLLISWNMDKTAGAKDVDQAIYYVDKEPE